MVVRGVSCLENHTVQCLVHLINMLVKDYFFKNRFLFLFFSNTIYILDCVFICPQIPLHNWRVELSTIQTSSNFFSLFQMETSATPSFDLVTALRAAQERAERRLKYREEEAFRSLSLVEEKYPWLRDPFHEGKRGQQDVRPQPQTPKPVPPVQTQQPQQQPQPVKQAPPPARPPQNDFSGPETVEIQRSQCPYCGRYFAVDRVERHSSVCSENPAHKLSAAKRGTMDMAAKRIGGVV